MGKNILITAENVSATSEWIARSWLRRYATSRKVAGSILDNVIGFSDNPEVPGAIPGTTRFFE
jgi:hypothetical protein